MKISDRIDETSWWMSNAEIAERLAGLAQLMAAGKENPYRVKAYQRAAARLRTFSESIDELVREEADLTAFAGISDAIAACIREIVLTGTLTKLENCALPPARNSRASPHILASIRSASFGFTRGSASIR